MYFLSYESSVEFQQDLRRAVLGGRELSEFDTKDQSLSRRFRELNRGDLNSWELDLRTREILAELSGQSPAIEALPKIMEDGDRGLELDVARAMVLSEHEFGYLDPISLRLTKKIFDDLAEGGTYSFSGKSLRNGGQSLQKFGPLSWDELLQGPMADYLLPGQYMVTASGVERPDLQLTLSTPQGKFNLELAVKAVGSLGLRWYRGSLLMLKKSHAKLLEDLNAVLEDYSKRLNLMERYRNEELKIGLSEAESFKLAHEIAHFYRGGIPNYSIIRGGVSFGDEYLRLGDDERGYLLRCSDCSRILGLEIVQRFDRERDWSSTEIFRNRIIEHAANRELVSFHGRARCQGIRAVSPRTGREAQLGGYLFNDCR